MLLRNYVKTDCAQLARLFYDTVHTVNAKDYTQEQLAAWATGKVNLEAWNESLQAHHTVVAEMDGKIVGFGDMDEIGYDNGRQFVIYCWNIFSTIIFVQECLKRFGNPGDQFILSYREKDEKEAEAAETEAAVQGKPAKQSNGYRNSFSYMLLESKNLIFRGAPGTGKSYLAKEIAADIISNGYFDDYTLLTDEQKKQVRFPHSIRICILIRTRNFTFQKMSTSLAP